MLDGSATGGLSAYTYSWTPTTGLDDPTVAQPTASPTATTTYTLTVTDSLGQTANDTAVVTIPTGWARAFGGTGDDRVYSVQETSDGGFVVGGYTVSFGAGDQDALVLRLDSNGAVVWQKAYGGTGLDHLD